MLHICTSDKLHSMSLKAHGFTDKEGREVHAANLGASDDPRSVVSYFLKPGCGGEPEEQRDEIGSAASQRRRYCPTQRKLAAEPKSLHAEHKFRARVTY